MGRLRLWQFSQLMIYGFQHFIRLEAVGLFDSQFRFVVHAFDTAIQNGSTSVEPIQQYLARGQDVLLDFPRGSDGGTFMLSLSGKPEHARTTAKFGAIHPLILRKSQAKLTGEHDRSGSNLNRTNEKVFVTTTAIEPMGQPEMPVIGSGFICSLTVGRHRYTECLRSRD
jgi:hypothetical protein